MRFDEKLSEYIERYSDTIPSKCWFEYKSIVKKISSVLRKYSDIDQYFVQDKAAVYVLKVIN